MTNCLHQVMLPKKPFVRPFQKSSTIIDLPFATTAFANSVASVCDDDMSKFSIKHSKYGGLFWSHNFPFISIYDVSFDVSPTLNHRNWRKALCKEHGDHRCDASTPSHSSADLPRIGLLTKLPCLALIAPLSSVASHAVLKWSSWDFPATPGFHPKRWQNISRNQ